MLKKLIKDLDKNLKIINYEQENNKITINLKSTKKTAECPLCGKKSHNVHSTHIRTIKDLPIQDNRVFLKLETRLFYCKNKDCKKTTFSENFDFVVNSRRMTKRLENKIVENAKGMSARASKQVLNTDTVDISDDTILRLLKKNDKLFRER